MMGGEGEEMLDHACAHTRCASQAMHFVRHSRLSVSLEYIRHYVLDLFYVPTRQLAIMTWNLELCSHPPRVGPSEAAVKAREMGSHDLLKLEQRRNQPSSPMRKKGK